MTQEHDEDEKEDEKDEEGAVENSMRGGGIQGTTT